MLPAEMTPRKSQVLATTLTILRKELNPEKVILFGSRAEGRHAPGSDFDLAVDVSRPDCGRAAEIEEAVNESIGLYKADIVYLPDVDADFRNLVLKTGRIVYERKT